MSLLKVKLRKASLASTQKNLNRLIEKVERQGKREALTKAGRPMVKAAKGNVSRDRGNLKKAIKGKIKTYKKDQIIVFMIGPDRNVKAEKDGETIRPERYAVPEEFGTVRRAGSAFMRRSFDGTKSTSFRIYKNELKKSIQRAGKRLSKNFKG